MKIYLAGPYSHPDESMRKARFEALNAMAARLMESGHTVFSPISHSHPIADHLPDNVRCSWPFWKSQDFPLLAWADEMHIYTLHGWQDSIGVSAEIEEARRLGKPIRLLEVVQ